MNQEIVYSEELNIFSERRLYNVNTNYKYSNYQVG